MLPNLDLYKEKKARRIVTIQKVDERGNYALYTKSYDLDKARLGELVEAAPTVEGPVSIAEIDEKITALDAEKAKWGAMKADLLAAV